jgi:DNA-3-methyladenine glycosylase
MPVSRLGREAFLETTLRAARDLLGKFLVRAAGGTRISVMIAEVEAYKGPADRASHAWSGRRTGRTEVLYAEGGRAYIYLAYGLHWLLNLTTGGPGRPECVLIRAAVSVQGAERIVLKGPGLLTRHLKIDGALRGVDVTESRELWVEDRGIRICARDVRRGPRIGIDYAGAYWASRPWRYWIDGTPGLRRG